MTTYQRIETSLKHFEKPVGDIRLYKRVLKHTEGDESLADDFCLSDYGGFTRSQLKRIKYKMAWNKNEYQRRTLCI